MKNTGKAHDNYGKLHKYDDEIRKGLAEGLTRYAIARKIGFDPSSVVNRANQLGLVFEHEKVEDHLEEILQLRRENYSVRYIARKLGFTHPTVSKLLKKHDMGTDRNIINVDNTFFEKIDTEEKAYCLGLLISDGFVQYGVVAITMTDEDVINKFKKAIQYEGNIRILPGVIEHHKTKYEMRINSIKLYNDVKQYGIIENKSLIVKFPDRNLIPSNMIPHLIRGIHDGDGCLTQYSKTKAWKIVFAGTLELLQEIEKILEVDGYFYHYWSANNTWHLTIRKQSQIIRSLEYMYQDATIYMERKKLLADKCLEDLRSRQ